MTIEIPTSIDIIWLIPVVLAFLAYAFGASEGLGLTFLLSIIFTILAIVSALVIIFS